MAGLPQNFEKVWSYMWFIINIKNKRFQSINPIIDSKTVTD